MAELTWPARDTLLVLREAAFDRPAIEEFLRHWVHRLCAPDVREKRHGETHLLKQGVPHFCDHLDRVEGATLADKWPGFERFWITEVKGRNATRCHLQTPVFQPAIILRLVAPTAPFLRGYRPVNWIRGLLPGDAPLRAVIEELSGVIDRLPNHVYSEQVKESALRLGVTMLLTKDLWDLRDIREADMINVKRQANGYVGADALDAALCLAGIFARTPLRGIARSKRPKPGAAIEDYVGLFRVPERFRGVTLLYVQHYRIRVSSRYATLRAKIQQLARFWIFIDEIYPALLSSADIRPEHTKAFIPHREAQARAAARRCITGGGDRRTTANHDLATIRTFFTDIACWSLEDGTPFRDHVPPAPPLTFRDTQSPEVTRAYRMRAAAITRRVIDLEREMPGIRAVASDAWRQACMAHAAAPDARAAVRAENTAFWDWALLELLVQSGLRIEEACNLTAFDILRRRDRDGRTYFLLHVAPSKFDRARLIPIGDALGKVLSEIIRHVKRFYAVNHVPPVDNFDFYERKPLPRAPYLLQGRTRPHVIGRTTIREMLAGISRRAGARAHDGQPLLVHPHDCRRVFASEHLNNGTPPHVLQALLGHERLDTVMIYAKLYPGTLVDAYRRHVRGIYRSVHGDDVLRAPTAEEWDALARSCDLRDMGTHLCALPAGEHCLKGLICLGCGHAQPKKSAMPIFERMRASHSRQLERAKARGEPLGQLAARRQELHRIEGALRRTRDISADVATAMEEALQR